MQIVYFPYLALGTRDEIDFGWAKVWNFEQKAQEYIPDESTRDHISRIIESNIHHNQPIKDVGVISIGQTDFREFNDSERNLATEVSLLLFLASLSYQCTLGNNINAGLYMRTAENFQVTAQNFTPGDLYIGETSGYIVNIDDMGCKIGEKKFYAPSCLILIRLWNFAPDEELIRSLLMLKESGDKVLYNRIIRATELFRQSYYNNDAVSPEARVLLHCAAFETLLVLTTGTKRKGFMDKVEDYCSLPDEERFTSYHITRRGKTEPEAVKRTMKGAWAGNYYELRNKIAHGDEVGQKDFIFNNSDRHFYIATLFYVRLVKELINKKTGRDIFLDQITWEKVKNNGDTKEVFAYNDGKLAKAILGLRREIKKAKNRARKQGDLE